MTFGIIINKNEFLDPHRRKCPKPNLFLFSETELSHKIVIIAIHNDVTDKEPKKNKNSTNGIQFHFNFYIRFQHGN